MRIQYKKYNLNKNLYNFVNLYKLVYILYNEIISLWYSRT